MARVGLATQEVDWGPKECRQDETLRSPSPERKAKRHLRVLYLFAGVQRRNNIQKYVKQKCRKRKWKLTFKEVDLAQHGVTDDLLEDKNWLPLRKSLNEGEWDTLLATPPCGEFSRAKWANVKGPKPLRSRQHPRGFPELKGAEKRKTDKVSRDIEARYRSVQGGPRLSCRYPVAR